MGSRDAFRSTSLDEMRTVLAAVQGCTSRGAVLPHTRQPECGCAELTECRDGLGQRPGAVTLEECVRCRCEALGIR